MADAADVVIKATDRASGPVKRVADSFDQIAKAARAARGQAQLFGSMVGGLRQHAQANEKAAQAAERARKAQEVLNRAAASKAAGGGVTGDFFGSLVGGVAIGHMAASALMGIANAAKEAALAVAGLALHFAKSVVEAAAFGERAELAFKLLMHGGENSKAQLQRVIAISGDLGLDVEETVKTFQKLLAMQFKPAMAEQLIRMGADLQAIGASSEEVSGALTAISQIKAKGRLQSEELLQLAERGVSTALVIDALSKSLGKSTQEVRKLMEAGKITADQGIAAIGEAIKVKTGEKQFGEAGAKFATSTLTGMSNVIKSKATAKMLELGALIREPLSKALGPITKDLLAALESPAAKEAMQSIADGFATIAGWVSVAWPLAKEFFMGLMEGLGPLKEMWSGLTSALGPALELLGLKGPEAASSARMLGQALALVIGAFALMAGVVAVVIGIFVAIPAAVLAAGYAYGQFVVAVVNWIASLPARIEAFAGEMWSKALSLGTSIIDGIVSGISSGVSTVVDAVKNVANSAITSAKTTLGIKSPSKVFEQIGDYATQGMSIGLQGGTGGVVSASSQLAASASAGAAQGLGGLGGGAPITINAPITIDGAKDPQAVVAELQRSFLANVAGALRRLELEGV